MLSTINYNCLATCGEKGDTSRACWWSMQRQETTQHVVYRVQGGVHDRKRPPAQHTVRHKNHRGHVRTCVLGSTKSSLLHSKASTSDKVPSRHLAAEAAVGGARALWQQPRAADRDEVAAACSKPRAAPPKSRPTPHRHRNYTTQRATTSQSSSLHHEHHGTPQAPRRTGTWGAAIVY